MNTATANTFDNMPVKDVQPEPKTFVKTTLVLERKLLKELLIEADELDLTLNELIKTALEEYIRD